MIGSIGTNQSFKSIGAVPAAHSARRGNSCWPRTYSTEAQINQIPNRGLTSVTFFAFTKHINDTTPPTHPCREGKNQETGELSDQELHEKENDLVGCRWHIFRDVTLNVFFR